MANRLQLQLAPQLFRLRAKSAHQFAKLRDLLSALRRGTRVFHQAATRMLRCIGGLRSGSTWGHCPRGGKTHKTLPGKFEVGVLALQTSQTLRSTRHGELLSAPQFRFSRSHTGCWGNIGNDARLRFRCHEFRSWIARFWHCKFGWQFDWRQQWHARRGRQCCVDTWLRLRRGHRCNQHRLSCWR
jgi:hypothetical protein